MQDQVVEENVANMEDEEVCTLILRKFEYLVYNGLDKTTDQAITLLRLFFFFFFFC